MGDRQRVVGAAACDVRAARRCGWLAALCGWALSACSPSAGPAAEGGVADVGTAAPDAQTDAGAVDRDAPVSDAAAVDAPTPDAPPAVDIPPLVDAPAIVDAPAPLDAPTVIDAPPAIDVPALVDRSPGVDVTTAPDVPVAIDRPSVVDVPIAVDVPGATDRPPAPDVGDAPDVPPLCTPGSASCASATLRRVCAPSGLEYVTATCVSRESCTSGVCTPWTCTPGEATCADGATRSVCDPDGLGRTATPCGAMSSCAAGVCRAWTCTPLASTCVDGRTARLCSADGLSATTTDCGSTATCNPSTGSCSTWLCVPGQATCPSASSRRVCNPDGLGFATASCGSRETCTGGACQPWVCTPDARDCADMSTTRVCAGSGLASTTQACGGGQSCRAGACAAWTCTPNAVACDGNSLRTCNPDGLGSTATPCAAPANSTATCSNGACGFSCAAGYVPSAGTCAPLPAPRLVSPLINARTGRRPTFRWELAPGTDGGRLQLCTTFGCTTVLQEFDVTGSSYAPVADVPTTALFWRVLPRAGGVTAPTTHLPRRIYVGVRGREFRVGGDVDNDTYADLVFASFNSFTSSGQVILYRGTPTGPAPTYATGIIDPVGASGTGFATRTLSIAGDVNGDGFADLIVGSPLNRRVYVFHGRSTGLGSTPTTTITGPNQSFGEALAYAGDVNGDGYDDVIVGSPNAPSTDPRVFVYRGSATGLVAAATASFALSGASVATAGDLNADGYDDVVFGDGSNLAYVVLGSAAGITSSATPVALPNTTPAIAYGCSVAGLGDVNGDGYGDVAVGACGTNDMPSTRAEVSVFHGAASGVNTVRAFLGVELFTTRYAFRVAAGGDAYADSYGDVFVGTRADRTYLYTGRATGLSSTPQVFSPPTGAPQASTGGELAGVGDVNGDGYTDLAVTDAVNRRVLFYEGSTSARGTPSAIITGVPGLTYILVGR